MCRARGEAFNSVRKHTESSPRVWRELYMEKKMRCAFVSNGNEPIGTADAKTAKPPEPEWTLERFKNELIERGVGTLEIVWGNYIDYFNEIPKGLMNRYLHHRRTHLHKRALELSLFEQALEESHPFAM